MPEVSIEVENGGILEEATACPSCPAVVSPSIREKRSWGATLIGEPGPVVGRPGNRFQSELELMGFSHKGGHSLRKTRVAEQPGAYGWKTHVGSHCYFPFCY